jgi:hypothetical protein
MTAGDLHLYLRKIFRDTILRSQNASRKWAQRYCNWNLILNQLTIFFEGRIEKYL